MANEEYTQIDPGPVVCRTPVPEVLLDFNFGARVQVPEGNWRVRIIDMGASTVVCDMQVSKTTVGTTKHYFIPWRVEIYRDGELKVTETLNLSGKRVLIRFCSGAMGDSLAWIPYVEEFRKKHGCEVWCAISPVMAELLAPAYPDLHFVAPRERPGGLYASYYVGCFFPSDNRTYQPMSWKRTGLQGAAAEILGLPRQEIRPRLPEEDAGRIIKEPYVCIAVQASSQPKYWNNPMGWMEVVAWLKERGYRVLCIDREKCYGDSWHKNLIPWGAEDFTGNHPLKERMEMLRHADFFIGLASGLSWLAWAAGIPVVMISGFSLPMTEFSTPYRIINYHVCNGCWEDDRFDFEHGRFDWCPRHQEDKEKQFECTRAIASPQVISAIQRLMEDHGLDPQTDQKES